MCEAWYGSSPTCRPASTDAQKLHNYRSPVLAILRRYVVAERLLKARDTCLWRREQRQPQTQMSNIKKGESEEESWELKAFNWQAIKGLQLAGIESSVGPAICSAALRHQCGA